MFKKNFYLTVFGIYQFFSVLMIALGILPPAVFYANLALQLAAVLLFDLEYGLLSIIISIPFYIAFPIKNFDTFQSWRIIFAVFFVVVLLKKNILSYVRGAGWSLNRAELKLFSWDKSLLLFGIIAAISAVFAHSHLAGIKKLLFVINIYLLYFVALKIWKTREQFGRAIYALFAATASMVLIGYAQLVSTFFSSTYYFWQYWAAQFAKTYYGTDFYQTAVYSNSWFAFGKGGAVSLRMFSIMPDSHSFALVALFSVLFAIGALYLSQKTWQKVFLWIYILFAMLAVIFSGTKGVWVGIAALLLVSSILSLRKYGRKIIEPVFACGIIFVVLFAASPFIQDGINQIRAGRAGNFIQRAETIYDLNESSNAGRIYIWKKTLLYSAKHPLLGTGYGNFAEITSPYASEIKKIFNLPVKDITAHNLYLGFLAETGIFGLIAALVYFGKILQTHWDFFKKHYLYSEDPFPVYVVAAGLVLMAVFVYSLVDETLYNDRVLMIFFLVLALSAAIINEYA